MSTATDTPLWAEQARRDLDAIIEAYRRIPAGHPTWEESQAAIGRLVGVVAEVNRPMLDRDPATLIPELRDVLRSEATPPAPALGEPKATPDPDAGLPTNEDVRGIMRSPSQGGRSDGR